MAWVAVNKDGVEFIYEEKPTRGKNYWEPAIIGQMPSANDWGEEDYDNIYDDYVRLPKGYIKKLIGKGLSWEDEPVELEKDDSIDENQQGKTTIYQIWCDHTTVSGGFVDGSNYPTQLMFTTLEKARQNKPENDYSTGNSREYYIKEVEID